MRQLYQHVLITGGSSGIGKAIAHLLAQDGANLSLIARNPDRLNLAQAELSQVKQQDTQQILTFSADVAVQAQVEQAVQGAIAQLGPPDLLITCAGIAHPGYFQDLPLEIFERTMAVNYFGTLYCIRAVLPTMMQRGRGHISMVSSGAGLIGLFGYTAYGPSKFALRGLAESLRAELKPLGIGVSITYPPDTDTPQLAEETKTKPLETQEITATAGVWQPADVASTILNGIRRNRFAIAPGTEMGVLHRCHSLLAPGLNWYFDRIVARHQRAGGRSPVNPS
ncbi:MAG: SDR family oxidoreductase [Synechococcales bacterium]|nr:SDR family oxidoreductase [Synechococcales bacterium]